MRYANTGDSEHTDGRLLVNKAQGANTAHFPSQYKLSDMSVGAGQQGGDDWHISGTSDFSNIRRQWTSSHFHDYYMAMIIVRTKDWMKGNKHLSVCT